MFNLAYRGRLVSVALSAIIALSPSVAMARGSHGHSGHGHFSHNKDKDKKTNTNSNGQDSTDRDTGHGRAEDRMSQNGLNHNNAGIADTDATTTSGGH